MARRPRFRISFGRQSAAAAQTGPVLLRTASDAPANRTRCPSTSEATPVADHNRGTSCLRTQTPTSASLMLRTTGFYSYPVNTLDITDKPWRTRSVLSSSPDRCSEENSFNPRPKVFPQRLAASAASVCPHRDSSLAFRVVVHSRLKTRDQSIVTQGTSSGLNECVQAGACLHRCSAVRHGHLPECSVAQNSLIDEKFEKELHHIAG